MAAKLGLSPEELREIDVNLKKLVDAREYAERLAKTGIADLTEEIVGIQQMEEGLNRLKSEFGPTSGARTD